MKQSRQRKHGKFYLDNVVIFSKTIADIQYTNPKVMHNDFDQGRLSRSPDFAQRVGPGTKHASPNYSIQPASKTAWLVRTSTLAIQISNARQTRWLFLDFKNAMFIVTILEQKI